MFVNREEGSQKSFFFPKVLRTRHCKYGYTTDTLHVPRLFRRNLSRYIHTVTSDLKGGNILNILM